MLAEEKFVVSNWCRVNGGDGKEIEREAAAVEFMRLADLRRGEKIRVYVNGALIHPKEYHVATVHLHFTFNVPAHALVCFLPASGVKAHVPI